MPVEKVLHQRSLTDQVMDYVRESAGDGTMTTGQWYSVYQLSELLGISRSPVRDALLRLEEAGLIKFTRNRGFQIVETQPSDVAEIFALRLGIEPPAAYRAATNRSREQLAAADELAHQMSAAAQAQDQDTFFLLDRKLHELILHMGQAFRGAELVDRLRGHTEILGASTAGSQRTLKDIFIEHQPILEAIRSGNATAARAAMYQHLQTTGRLLLEQTVEKLKDKESRPHPEEIWDRHAAGI